MFIELNEAQLRYAIKSDFSFDYIERTIDDNGFLIMHEGYESSSMHSDDLDSYLDKRSIFYVHKDDYEDLPAKMRALSSPEPNAQPTLPDSSHLAVFDEQDQEYYFGNEPDDTTLILKHIVVDSSGKEVSSGVEIQKDLFERTKKVGYKFLIEKVMKKDHTSTPAQEPTKEPDYKALALLLIDLFEEKREIDSKIAAIKAQLQ